MQKVSAIIVNYNAGSVLINAVRSLLSSSSVVRIVIVDNASDDNSMRDIEKMADAEPRILCIRNNKNLGFAKACNMGIAADGDSDYLLFSNPDCVFDRDALEKLVSCLKSSPDAGMAGPLVLNPDGTEQAGGRRSVPTPWRSFVRAFGLAKFSRHFSGIFSDFLLHELPLPQCPVVIEAISGSCMLVKKEALLEVGYLDVGYFLHCEDLDWCVRFQQRDWKIMFVPDARVTHYKGVCSRNRTVFVEWHKHKGMIRFYKKFFQNRYPVPLLWIIESGVWLRFAMVAFYYGLKHLRNWVKNDIA